MDSKVILNFIKSRRSRRKFAIQLVDEVLVENILEAARWAPSGKNNQPWRFIIVRNSALKARLANFTCYSKIIQTASIAILIFIYRPSTYDEAKDYQSIGACIQNMLLMAEAQGLAAVWLGEIAKNDKGVRNVLGLTENFLLVAVVAIGWPLSDTSYSSRKSLDELVLTYYK